VSGVKTKNGIGLVRIIIRVVLLIWCAMVVLPVIWTIYSSLKTNAEFYSSPWALPRKMAFVNYYNAWVSSHISVYFLNSIFVVTGTLILHLIFSTTTAYALAKYNFTILKYIKKIYIAAMMVPGILILVPLYFQCLKLGMLNSLSAITLLYAIGGVPFSVFLLEGFFRGVHNSFIEAAIIDGCSEFKLFFKIMIPMIKPGVFIVALLNIMGTWNEYPMAITFLTKEMKLTVPVGIQFLVGSMQYRTDFGALFAGLILSMIPIVIVYAIFQKPMQEGMAMGSGIKG
jgi:N-acetylglucosamine transport system permease protein